MRHTHGILSLLFCSALLAGCGGDNPPAKEPPALHLHFLEIVTPEVDAVCAAYKTLHGATFSEPVPEFGMARTATLPDGGLVSIRAPMRPDEAPIVRPYIRVDDIDAAAKAAVEAGGVVAFPPTEIPGRGKVAIYIHGGIDHGLFQP